MPTPKSPLRIIGLQVENFKRLKAISITPRGNLIQITGKNGQGKTCILDAIFAALGGKEYIPDVPIRNGEDRCRICLDLGEIIVTRIITAKNTTLTVESADGAVFKSPQTILDAIWGLTLDPLAFKRMKLKEQGEQLRKVSKIDLDIDALDAQNRLDYDRRTAVNRDAKTARAAADSIEIKPVVALIPLAPLMDRLQAITQQTTARDQERGKRDEMLKQLAEQKIRETKLRAELEKVSTWISETESYLHDLPPLPEVDSPEAIRQELANAETQNRESQRIAAEQERRTEHANRAKGFEADAAALTESIDTRERAKTEALAAAQLPIPGLGFKDGIVTYNDLPFDQASEAEQLRVSTAIAMAGEPRLKVIRITDGSLLDSNSMALLEQMAADAGYQVWIEQVDDTGKIGVYIEDGEVRADNQ